MTQERVQHTPGPWRAEGSSVMDADDLVIADAWTFAAPDREGQAEANADLIAAAPDLLEALELVAELHENGLEPDEVNWPVIYAAIAKARGEAVQA